MRLVVKTTAVMCLAAAMWQVAPLLDAQHSIVSSGVAHPGRTPPNPAFFPNYMQNKQGMWLYWRQWSPKVAPKGVIFLVGGLGEHSGRYDQHAKRFNALGYVVFSMDNQGQGGSEGDRIYVERFDDYIDDAEQFVKLITTSDAALAALPRFVLGHSMGGLITAHLALRHPALFSGVVLSSPALEADPAAATPFIKAAAHLLADYVPKLPLDHLDDGDLVSRSPQFQQQYPHDARVPHGAAMRARWGSELMKAMDALWPRVGRATFPLLVVQGDGDVVCSVDGSRRFVAAMPAAAGGTIKVYPALRHEVFYEPEADAVFADVAAFLNATEKRVTFAWD
jgi:acylglycerol lipase